MVSGKIKGIVKQRLSKAINRYAGKGASSYYLDAPSPEMDWWYYQEYGTGTRGEPGKASGAYYVIEPITGKYLKFLGADGNAVFTKKVNHPGIPARYSVAKTLPELRTFCKEVFASADILSGEADLDALNLECIEKAKELIYYSLADNLSSGREDGKLGGIAPEDVFEQLVEIKKRD